MRSHFGTVMSARCVSPGKLPGDLSAMRKFNSAVARSACETPHVRIRRGRTWTPVYLSSFPFPRDKPRFLFFVKRGFKFIHYDVLYLAISRTALSNALHFLHVPFHSCFICFSIFLDRKRQPLGQSIGICAAACKCREKTVISSARPMVTLREKLTGAYMIKIHESKRIKPSPISVDSGKPGFDPFTILPSKLEGPAMPQSLFFCARYEFNMTMPYDYGALNYKLYKKQLIDVVVCLQPGYYYIHQS